MPPEYPTIDGARVYISILLLTQKSIGSFPKLIQHTLKEDRVDKASVHYMEN